jgi:ketosteroid isomerase-like protein
VNRSEVEAWIEAYERAWRSPGIEALAELFTEDASYRLSPYDDPALGLEAIGALWERERKGPDEVFTLTSEVFAVAGDRAVVTLEVRYGDLVEREFRDVWLLQFEGDRCARFEEWAFWPDKPYTAEPALPFGQA